MSTQDIAVIVSRRLYDCTPEEAVVAFNRSVGSIVTKNGEAEVLDVNLLFPKEDKS